MATQISTQRKAKIRIPRKKLTEFSHRWKVTELAFFGSVLREDFRSGSDIDILISFNKKARVGLLDMVRMENELKEIFRRDVDLVERRAIEKSENYIRRKNILNNIKVVYAAR